MAMAGSFLSAAVLERVREWLQAHTGRECPRQHTEHVMMMKTMVEVVRWA